MTQLVNKLKEVLANTFALYLKTQYYHWNVEGPDFSQLHNFFSDLYQEIYGSVDRIAEQIRALGSYSPGSFERFIELSSIKGEDRVLNSKDMIQQLLIDNEKCIVVLTSCYYLAEDSKEIGLTNFLQDRVDQHKKHIWMLKSFLKG